MASISRDDLKKYLVKDNHTDLQKSIAELRLQYSSIATLRNTFLSSIRNVERITPTILPIQASGRWSYIDPPLSGFPKKCINPECVKYEHEKTKECWSIRDCLLPDKGTFWIEHDLDAVEHRIYCLLLQWEERLNALKTGLDIHTPVTCNLFNLPMPCSLLNPHTSEEDVVWRKLVQWQGKDDSRRTISKNFTYGGQYFYVRFARKNEKVRRPYRIYDNLWYNPSYVYAIPNIQSYRIRDTNPKSDTYGTDIPPDFESMAIRFVENKENIEMQKRKAIIMEKCRKDKVSRTLYGGRRVAWFSNHDTAKELFNHIIQGTVASYINESCILLQKRFPESYLVHNQHDSLKWAFPYNSTNKENEENQVLEECKRICQRELVVGKNSINISATFKITRLKDGTD